MADYLDHSARWQSHRQPRDRRVDHTTPGFVRPPDPEPCPNDHGDDGVIACWSPGGPCPVPNDPACDTCGPCFHCTDRHPLTPADPHPHAWADLGTPGLHGSVCRLCGETQID